MKVTDRDRQAMRRQAAALRVNENIDEGDSRWQAAIAATADRHRADAEMAPLEPWWSTKTETEMHKRARALGLLDRVR